MKRKQPPKKGKRKKNTIKTMRIIRVDTTQTFTSSFSSAVNSRACCATGGSGASPALGLEQQVLGFELQRPVEAF